MAKDKILIFGCNGYSGRLILQELLALGVSKQLIVAAGRNREAIAALAKEFSLPHTDAFDLSDNFEGRLAQVKVVLHCAGPYSHTSKQMVDACISTATHYLDITGEVDVFEAIAARHADAVAKHILLIPGVGFDVVPTDCLALMLKQKLPSATQLHLFIAGSNPKPSAGTLRTMIEGLTKDPIVRENSVIRHVPHGYKTNTIAFPSLGKRFVTVVPWGDLSTAFHTTKIAAIYTYMPILPKPAVAFLSAFGFLVRFFFMIPFVLPLLSFLAGFVKGPSEKERTDEYMEVVGAVKDGATNTVVTGSLRCPNGYTFTARAAARIGKSVLEQSASLNVKEGFATPAAVFGADFAATIEGVVVGPFGSSPIV